MWHGETADELPVDLALCGVRQKKERRRQITYISNVVDMDLFWCDMG
jgi:hypothetical protein